MSAKTREVKLVPTVDLSFPLSGKHVPVDHGYMLFSAINRIIPEIHGNPQIGIHPIRGLYNGNGHLILSRISHLTVRLDADDIKLMLPLAGKSLSLNGENIQAGIPRILVLQPVASLQAKMVTIKGFIDPEIFQEALHRQLQELDIHPEKVETGQRRTLKIQDKKVVGFQVRLTGLTADESLLIQEKGLGGRRRFGCGVFVRYRG
jgi:CRISPR-associated protein Cas6